MFRNRQYRKGQTHMIMVNLINMPFSRTNVTAIEQNSETQNLIPNAMKRDNDIGEYTINHLESGRIIIIFAQTKRTLLDYLISKASIEKKVQKQRLLRILLYFRKCNC